MWLRLAASLCPADRLSPLLCCRSRGKTPEQVVAFLNEGAFDMARFKEEGLVTDLR